MKKSDSQSTEREKQEKGEGLKNFMKLIFLITVLVVSWYLLDWLISRK